METTENQKEVALLPAPNVEGNVWPKQNCPAFTPRSGAQLEECWYCVHADFHLVKPRALEVGICYWPRKVLE